jgi:hypothetical protein
MSVSLAKYVKSTVYSGNGLLPVEGNMQCLAGYCKVFRQDIRRRET